MHRCGLAQAALATRVRHATPNPVQAIGDELVDSIVSDNIPVLAEDAKYNEAVTSSLRRIEVGQPHGSMTRSCLRRAGRLLGPLECQAARPGASPLRRL